MYLFDASAIVNLVKRGNTRIFLKGATLDLAIYEAINAIWKEHVLLKNIDRDTAITFIDIIHAIFNVMKTFSIGGFEKEIFELACKEHITIYDAAYLYHAIRGKLTLVTDDRKLREVALKYVRVASSMELSRLEL